MKFSIFNFQFSNKSFTLVEVLVGTFLISIVFLGIFGAYQLSLKVVGVSKNKITATQIANREIEKIRNLPYADVGIKGAKLPYAEGKLDSTTTTIQNGIEYKIETQVKYIIDESDGIGSADPCNWDYKRVEVKVSWSGRFGGEVKLITDIAPKNKIEEIAVCQTQPGGILSVSVFNAYGEMITSPLIEIFNPDTQQLIASYTPINGKQDIPLAASTYKVVVSKDNYSREETFGPGDIYQGKTIVTPERPNPIVLLNQITEISFSIDKISSFSINTLSPGGSDIFFDSFLDESKTSEKSNVVIEEGEVKLEGSNNGYLFSTAISPENLVGWGQFSFTDFKPDGTDLKYQLYYASGTDWVLIPESDLPGNSQGFDVSPVDLSNLATTTYSQLKLKGIFSTNSTTTPILYDWQLDWKISLATPIVNTQFSLRGKKIVGLDAEGNKIYKYSITTSSDSHGNKILSGLEWDLYTFSVDPETGLDLLSTEPSPQPISLLPDENLQVNLYLDAENSLLLTVQNSQTLEPVFSATARLYNLGLGYDKTQYTDEKGQTIFIPLEPATYNLEIEAAGYLSTSTILSISGDKNKTIKIEEVK